MYNFEYMNKVEELLHNCLLYTSAESGRGRF